MGIQQRKERERRAMAEGILAAARAIAGEEGWPAVTMRKIAARIEYSPPALYEYFDSKEAILLALLRRGYAEQLAATERPGGCGEPGGRPVRHRPRVAGLRPPRARPLPDHV